VVPQGVPRAVEGAQAAPMEKLAARAEVQLRVARMVGRVAPPELRALEVPAAERAAAAELQARVAEETARMVARSADT
jgi:hypothetical protein